MKLLITCMSVMKQIDSCKNIAMNEVNLPHCSHAGAKGERKCRSYYRGTKWECVVGVTPSPHLTPKKGLPVPIG